MKCELGVSDSEQNNKGNLPHATETILDLDVTKLLVSKSLDFLEEFALGRNDLLQSLLEIWFGRGRVRSTDLPY
jgi:hypothetical protein